MDGRTFSIFGPSTNYTLTRYHIQTVILKYVYSLGGNGDHVIGKVGWFAGSARTYYTNTIQLLSVCLYYKHTLSLFAPLHGMFALHCTFYLKQTKYWSHVRLKIVNKAITCMHCGILTHTQTFKNDFRYICMCASMYENIYIVMQGILNRS